MTGESLTTHTVTHVPKLRSFFNRQNIVGNKEEGISLVSCTVGEECMILPGKLLDSYLSGSVTGSRDKSAHIRRQGERHDIARVPSKRRGLLSSFDIPQSTKLV